MLCFVLAEAKRSVWAAFQRACRIQQGLVAQYLCCSLRVCCPLAPSSEEPCDSVKNIIYSVSFPTIGVSAPAEAVAGSAEWESQARASGKPEVFEWPASGRFKGEWFQFLCCCFCTEPNILCAIFFFSICFIHPKDEWHSLPSMPSYFTVSSTHLTGPLAHKELLLK